VFKNSQELFFANGSEGILSQSSGAFRLDTLVAGGDTFSFVVGVRGYPDADETALRPVSPSVGRPNDFNCLCNPARAGRSRQPQFNRRSYASGTGVTLTAKPNAGYQFAGWVEMPAVLTSRPR